MDKEKPMNVSMTSLFGTPVMQIKLDLDLEKLTEFSFQIQKKDKKGVQHTTRGGWQSNNVTEENHEEFIRLKKEINQYLQIYHSEVFGSMEFKENIMQGLDNILININEKYHYNEWHLHPHSTLSGVYYIKHDGSQEGGDILFKHPNSDYMRLAHWPQGVIEIPNEITSEIIDIVPKSNMLLIFPSWLEHKVEANLKNNSSISISFNSQPILVEKKSQWVEKK